MSVVNDFSSIVLARQPLATFLVLQAAASGVALWLRAIEIFCQNILGTTRMRRRFLGGAKHNSPLRRHVVERKP
jgi:hypothetical protein